MKPTIWFRIAAVLLFLFAAGHTFGFMAFRPSTAAGRAVWTAMNSVRFAEGRSTFSYGGFYTGFGLSITTSQLFTAWLAWWLGSMWRRSSVDARAIAWGLIASQLVGLALSLRYFAAGPAVFSAITTACLVAGVISIRRSTARS